MKKPVETKVVAGAGGGGSGGVAGVLILWVLGASVWHGGWGADQVSAAIAAVPSPIVMAVPLVLGAVGSFIAGYLAPHTPATPVQPAYVGEHEPPVQ